MNLRGAVLMLAMYFCHFFMFFIDLLPFLVMTNAGSQPPQAHVGTAKRTSYEPGRPVDLTDF